MSRVILGLVVAGIVPPLTRNDVGKHPRHREHLKFSRERGGEERKKTHVPATARKKVHIHAAADPSDTSRAAVLGLLAYVESTEETGYKVAI